MRELDQGPESLPPSEGACEHCHSFNRRTDGTFRYPHGRFCCDECAEAAPKSVIVRGSTGLSISIPVIAGAQVLAVPPAEEPCCDGNDLNLTRESLNALTVPLRADTDYELAYATGGHGGPHHGLAAALVAAIAVMKGNRSETRVYLFDRSRSRQDGYLIPAKSDGWLYRTSTGELRARDNRPGADVSKCFELLTAPAPKADADADTWHFEAMMDGLRAVVEEVTPVTPRIELALRAVVDAVAGESTAPSAKPECPCGSDQLLPDDNGYLRCVQCGNWPLPLISVVPTAEGR
jgi:hypothetical protein